jgi:hypothetical protein|tara:strand:- start:503 stop:679 length:177 start_codon:yes stop_codon:yes gene_type:complete
MKRIKEAGVPIILRNTRRAVYSVNVMTIESSKAAINDDVYTNFMGIKSFHFSEKLDRI